MSLPAGYTHKLIYRAKLGGLSGIVRSQDGTIYVRQGTPAGGVEVSTLDPTTGALKQVMTESSASSGIVGGPKDSFLIAVGPQVRQYSADGTHAVWGKIGGDTPIYYTSTARLLGISGDGTKVVEIAQDGSSTPVVSGLKMAYDVVGNKAGDVFVTDLTAGQLIHVDAGGTKTVVAAITPDNTHLAFDAAGQLYLNNAGDGFAEVDVATGQLTPVKADKAPCPVIQSPAHFVFTDGGKVLFASWAAARLTWADPTSGDGGWVVSEDWANTAVADVGTDHLLYLGVSGCGQALPSKVVRLSLDGDQDVFAAALGGDVLDLAMDEGAGVYVALQTATAAGIYHIAGKGKPPTLVQGSDTFETGSITVNPKTGALLAARFGAPGKAEANIVELDGTGAVKTHTVSTPEELMSLMIRAAPDGTLYGFADEKKRFMTGPEVRRYILKIDLASKTSTIVAQHKRVGCCPLDSFSVDASGGMWWILNPDLLLLRVDAKGTVTPFGKNMPVDSAAVLRADTGELFLNSPEGLYKIYKP